MKTSITVTLAALSFLGCDREIKQDKPQPGPQGKQDPQAKAAAKRAIEKFQAVLKKEGMSIDLKARTLSIPVVVNRPTNDLEFLLIHTQGKRHEALLVTECKPSVLNSGLLALGVKRGKNAEFVRKKPMPSEAELRQGADPFILVPPSGGRMYMTVAYTGKDGKKIELPIEELLLDWQANLSVADNQWVFLGGRMAQMYRDEAAVFMADFEGNLISICYKHPPNHLLTMDHAMARDEMNWAIGSKCPPPLTKLTLTFHANKPKIVADRELRVKQRAKAPVDSATRPERNPARPGGAPPPPRPKPTKPAKKGKAGTGK